MRVRTIRVKELARVEGEGALMIRMRGRVVEEVQLNIYEPPRFFEAFLRGRAPLEVPDLTARICGICPVAYQMSGGQAIEDAAGVAVDGRIQALRRLLYCGEWIESHALHIYLLHAPDFLGAPDAVALAKSHPEVVARGLRLKKAGNALMEAVGGREIHPVNARVGGFHRAPARGTLRALLPDLAWALEAARETAAWVAGFPFPSFERDYEFVALRHPAEYAITEGLIVSSRGLDLAVRDYETWFQEEQAPHSHALRSTIRGRGDYLVGPLARFNLNFDRLSGAARAAAKAAGLQPPCRNPFRSIVVRAVELVEATAEAIRLIESYEPPDPPFVETPARPGTGYGCTEAPRGILYHRYRIGADGLIEDAKIVPPTSQNQLAMEEDLRALAPLLAERSLKDATWLAEQAIRNYDPCISCATHFLTLKVERA